MSPLTGTGLSIGIKMQKPIYSYASEADIDVGDIVFFEHGYYAHVHGKVEKVKGNKVLIRFPSTATINAFWFDVTFVERP